MSKKKITAAQIRASLLGQLESKHADIPHFKDQVDQYVEFFNIKNMLIEDIKKNGVKIEETSSVGVKRRISNPAIKELQGTSRQMLSILRELGLTTDTVVPDDSEEL